MLAASTDYEKYEWDDELDKLAIVVHDASSDWFMVENDHVVAETFEAAADLDETLRNIERYRRDLEKKTKTEYLERRVKYIRDQTEDAKKLVLDIIGAHNHLIHQGYEDINTWFRSSGKSKHDYDSGDMSKQRREHQRLYFSYMRKLLVQLHADIILDEDRFPDPAGVDCHEFTALVKSFEQNIHAFTSFHWEMLRDITADVTPVDMVPTEEAHAEILEQHISDGPEYIEFGQLKRGVESHFNSEVSRDQLYRALRELHLDRKRAYQGVAFFNAHDENNLVQVMDRELRSDNLEAVFDDKVTLHVEVDIDGSKDGDFGKWHDAETWDEFVEHVMKWYNESR